MDAPRAGALAKGRPLRIVRAWWRGSHRQLCHKTPERRRTCTPSASSGGSLVSLQLFGLLFSSYTWKVLIALWADETPFKFRMLGPDHPENGDELRRRWPFGQFPLLVDGDPEAGDLKMATLI